MQVYIDNASTTMPHPEVIQAMQGAQKSYGNPSSVHTLGQQSKELIENSRNLIAEHINADPSEIVFTSGGTESNALALQGYMEAYNHIGTHIITTKTEHASVIETCKYLQSINYSVTYLDVDSAGFIDLNQLERAIRKNTILVSIMFANNEIGTIQPISKIGQICRRYGIAFHADAVQALGHCDIDVETLGVDMMSFSGHKIYADKGVGALYVRHDINLTPLANGGGQEFNLRSGTENTTGIVGFGKAVELIDPAIGESLAGLKAKLIDGIAERIPNIMINSPAAYSLPNIVSISFDGVEAETLLEMLDKRGIYASAGSACFSNKLECSHVLTSIGLTPKQAYSTVRFSLGRYSTESDIDYILGVLPELIENARRI